jgi:putative Holliday junction resolvase
METLTIKLSTHFVANFAASTTAGESGRILALDVGARRIGLAVSDPLGLTAQGLPTMERTNIRDDIERLELLARERGVGLLLIGHPKTLSGREGRQAVWVRDFADRLAARTGLPIEFWDERLTSVEAERCLREQGVRTRAGRKGAVDRLAAVFLLESYLLWRELHGSAGAPQ